jgi:DNA primase
VRERRKRNRLGDARRRGELPSRLRTAETGASSFSREACRTTAEEIHDRQTSSAGRHTIDDKRLLESVVQHYHETLKETPEAQQYLVKRGLESSEMVEQFRLGFANRTLGYHPPASNRSAGAEQRERLKQIGILRQESGHEHFNGSVIIPIFNLHREVVQMYGRKITPGLRPGTPLHSARTASRRVE